jgi:hypothetical protein
MAGEGASVVGVIETTSSSPASPETVRSHGVLLLPVGIRVRNPA